MKARLLLITTALLVVGIVASDAIVLGALRRHLVERVDRQLTPLAQLMARVDPSALGPALPSAVAGWIAKWWPSMAGLRVVTVARDPSVLAPWAGFGVLAAFGAVVLAAAFLVFARRDA